MDEIKTKKCGHCGKELPVEMFHKSASSKDGYQSYCKLCTNENSRRRRALAKQTKSELAFKVASIPSGENIEKITLSDGKTFRKVEAPVQRPSLDQFESNELLHELKERGYIWERMYVKKFIEYSKI